MFVTQNPVNDEKALPVSIPTYSEKVDKANDIKSIYCFQIADTYLDDSMLDALLKQGDPIDNFKKFNKDINESFEFIEITKQPLEVVGTYYEGSNIFVVSPRNKKDLRNQIVGICNTLESNSIRSDCI